MPGVATPAPEAGLRPGSLMRLDGFVYIRARLQQRANDIGLPSRTANSSGVKPVE